MRDYLLYPLLAVILSFSGCNRQQNQTQRIDRVAEQQRLTFRTAHGYSPSGYTLKVRGHITGTASITVSGSSAHMISGDVDWHIYHDYFQPSIDIQYLPNNVSAGSLTFDLTFH